MQCAECMSGQHLLGSGSADYTVEMICLAADAIDACGQLARTVSNSRHTRSSFDDTSHGQYIQSVPAASWFTPAHTHFLSSMTAKKAKTSHFSALILGASQGGSLELGSIIVSHALLSSQLQS